MRAKPHQDGPSSWFYFPGQRAKPSVWLPFKSSDGSACRSRPVVTRTTTGNMDDLAATLESLDVGLVANEAITASFLPASGKLLQEQPLTLLAHYRPGELLPIREPIAYRGQRHLPGLFWMSKLGRSVYYESRLEMVILKQLDFDPGLRDVLPQPFTLHFSWKGKRFHHTPDYLAWRTDAPPPRLINVKPQQYVARERNQRAFSACEAACSQIGWTYSTQSEPPPVILANLNWLAGFRRPPPDFALYATALAERAVDPTPIAVVLEGVGPPAIVRPVLFYLLWVRQLEFDINQRLSDASLVRLAPG